MADRITLAEYKDLLAQAAKTPPLKSQDKKSRRKNSLRLPKVKTTIPPSFLSSIMRLMACKYPQNLRLKPEEQLAIEFATALREATLCSRLKCVWTHPANEIAGRRDNLAKIRYTIAKAMGLIDGTSDYLFLWANGSGALEAKIGRNKQQSNQIDFEIWCNEMGVPYRTFTSVAEGLAILGEWGVLKSATKGPPG